MVSQRQLSANRRNSQKSTGPRSVGGKSRSSQNALVHGLTADGCLLPGEDADAFYTLREGTWAYFLPEETVEIERRVPGLEVDLFDWVRRQEIHSDE